MPELRFYRFLGMALLGASLPQFCIEKIKVGFVLLGAGVVIWFCGISKAQMKSWIA